MTEGLADLHAHDTVSRSPVLLKEDRVDQMFAVEEARRVRVLIWVRSFRACPGPVLRLCSPSDPSEPASMYLFTWNLGKRPGMADRALAHLRQAAASDRVVATLQELPEDEGPMERLIQEAGPELVVVRPTPTSKAILLYSARDFTLQESWVDDSKRAAVARLRFNESGKDIWCVGIHWHSRLSLAGIADHYARGGAIALFRHYLEERLSRNVPVVLMGDFNSHAGDGDMSSPFCLFACGTLDRPIPSMEHMTGRLRSPWFLVEPTVRAQVGTYFNRQARKWVVIDHIVLTRDLKVLEAEVLTELEGKTFLTEDVQVPRGEAHASDHLPVYCKVQEEGGNHVDC